MSDWVYDHTEAIAIALIVVVLALAATILVMDIWVHRNQVCEKSHQATMMVQVSKGVYVPEEFTECDLWVDK